MDPVLIEELCQTLVDDILENYKNKGVKNIIFAETFMAYVKDEGHLENSIVTNIDNSIIPKLPKSPKIPIKSLIHYTTPEFWQNNPSHIKAMAIFVVLLTMAMVIRGDQFMDMRNTDDNERNVCIILARACGQGINVCLCALILLMCRPLITLARKIGLHRYLPLDLHVTYHKACGVLVLTFSLIHGICHLINLSKSVVYNTPQFLAMNNIDKVVGTFSYSEWLFTSSPGIFGTIGGYGYPTGVLLSFILLVMMLGALPVIRRRGFFEVFYWSHLCYVLFFLLCIFHAPTIWPWLVLPGAIFLLSKILVFIRLVFGHRKSVAVECTALQSKVTKLVLEKEFDFSPGDYVFINIPSISRFEWHPFTISSAPEVSQTFGLHIRSAGGWTNALYDFVKKENEKGKEATEKVSNVQKMLLSINNKQNKIDIMIDDNQEFKALHMYSSIPHKPFKVYIDGPHGAPSSSIFTAEHAVLVATGIGVTPFASILHSLLERTIRGESLGSIQKVDFIWVNRDYRSLEWFLLLLRKLEISILKDMLDIQLYITAAPSSDQAETLSLALALELLYAKSSRDVITGLRTKCIAGRPDWARVLANIHDQSEHPVTLFYCGAPQVADIIQPICDKLGFVFKKEIF